MKIFTRNGFKESVILVLREIIIVSIFSFLFYKLKVKDMLLAFFLYVPALRLALFFIYVSIRREKWLEFTSAFKDASKMGGIFGLGVLLGEIIFWKLTTIKFVLFGSILNDFLVSTVIVIYAETLIEYYDIYVPPGGC